MLLDDLVAGERIAGLREGPVTLLQVERHGEDAATVTFRTDAGDLSSEILYAADAARLRPQRAESRWTFDADPERYRLAAEAMRMRMASLFDPMLAVSSSAIDPLPHQIRAVYEEMLPKPGALRFLLADDPGAGKTIMAGLYLKELVLRGDVSRALIVAPGGLVEQWQEELAEKFDLEFTLLSRELAEANMAGDPFATNPFLIARMDQLARDDEWLAHLDRSHWDLVVVDEAHRMAARYYGTEIQRTRRYELGERLGAVARHLLLMTATPHAGKEEDYQLFLALLEPDRFEGRFREGVHSRDTRGLMRRMLKEDLLKFDGRPLFPERIAETVPYQLSDLEQELYESVTQYVREEMNRADALDDGNGRRRRTVGFALTVLQRRLASSPRAIHESLRRRRERLEARRAEMLAAPVESTLAAVLDEREPASDWLELDVDDLDDEMAADELERLEDEVVDAATAARTAAELATEIAILAELEGLARRVLASGLDRKWIELRGLVDVAQSRPGPGGVPRKLIVFTEHRDTLEYLRERLTAYLGSDHAVVSIHGGTRRAERRQVRETFAQDPACQVLLATDAAGEGMNLQVAHLMVNYDLPWNPNRIEQRFGRIHRIGQTEVCRLWNLVAADTREGQVFERLLEKIEEQRRAFDGRVFDVLGEAFAERPLRELLMEAIRYGEQPEVRAQLEKVIDASVSKGLDELRQERALATPQITSSDLEEMRRVMEEARARRLQPHFIQLFVLEALRSLGGRASKREAGLFEVTHVPAEVREVPRSASPLRVLRPVASRYSRIAFDPAHAAGRSDVDLVAPGHPLMEALVDAVLTRDAEALAAGAVLVDTEAHVDEEPRLVVGLHEEIADGTGQVVSRRFQFVGLGADGAAALEGAAPYLDLEPVPGDVVEAVRDGLSEPWWDSGVEAAATSWSVRHGLPAHRGEIEARVVPEVERVRNLVRQRLTTQVNVLHAEAARAAEDQAAGRRVRVVPATLRERADDLEVRLARRMAELDRAGTLVVRPPRVATAFAVVPAGRVDGLRATGDVPAPSVFAADTTVTDRRAVDAVLRAERALGRVPVEMPHNNKGYDVLSTCPDGTTIRIEVKGRVVGAEDFVITLSEVLLAKNAAPAYRLALVEVDPGAAPGAEPVRYVRDPFPDLQLTSYVEKVVLDWRDFWVRGTEPD